MISNFRRTVRYRVSHLLSRYGWPGGTVVAGVIVAVAVIVIAVANEGSGDAGNAVAEAPGAETATAGRMPTSTPAPTATPIPAASPPAGQASAQGSVSLGAPTEPGAAPHGSNNGQAFGSQQPLPEWEAPIVEIEEGLDYDWARTIVRLTNQARSARGLSTLREDASLRRAMEKYVEFVWRTNGDQLSHTLDGNPWDRAQREGYNYSGIGENLWAALWPEYQTPDQAFSGWMNSPGHRANILTADYVDIGVGCFRGKWVRPDGVPSPAYVCGQLFGIPVPPAPTPYPTPPPAATPVPLPTTTPVCPTPTPGPDSGEGTCGGIGQAIPTP